MLFLPPSDAYVRSFLYLLYALIKLHYTKALSDPALSLAPDWIPLLRRPRIPASYHSATAFHWHASVHGVKKGQTRLSELNWIVLKTESNLLFLTFISKKNTSVSFNKVDARWDHCATYIHICIYSSCCLEAQSYLTLCNPMDCSTPGFPVIHYLPEFSQTHVHWVNDAIQSSHPLCLLLLPSTFPA